MFEPSQVDQYNRVKAIDDLPVNDFAVTHVYLGTNNLGDTSAALSDQDLEQLHGREHLVVLDLTGTSITK